ncbi:MAG: metal-sensitive transcriptional regulator [Cyclobacteriaceae bacterium]
MNLPIDLTKDIITKLKSIKGQIGGLTGMLENDIDPEKVLVQFKAVQKALDKSPMLLLEEVYRKTLALTIVETIDACPDNCGNEERIEFIRKQFPNLKINDSPKKCKKSQRSGSVLMPIRKTIPDLPKWSIFSWIYFGDPPYTAHTFKLFFFLRKKL